MANAPSFDLVRLFLEHRDGILGFILALTHDREAAEEIFQEVGLAVVEEAGRKREVLQFLPWIHEMARRRIAEFYRRTSRRRALEHSESMDDVLALAFQEAAADPSAVRRRQEHLETCIRELNPSQRELLEQRYREHLPLRRIADRSASTEGSVKVLLWRLRRQLARCIEGKLESSGEGI